MDNKIRARLKAFAEGLSGPLGSVPLDRAIRAELELFRLLRESSATWPQIANALAVAGARRPDGSLISADHVRSAVTRQMKRNPPLKAFKEPPAPPIRQQSPRLTRGAPTANETSSKRQISGMNTGIHEMGDNEPGKEIILETSTSSSSYRNQLILDKLARTRKLRES